LAQITAPPHGAPPVSASAPWSQCLASVRLPWLKMAQMVAHQHHEKFDGTGYPQGLRGEEIHPAARIVALADVYDALTSNRVYRPAHPHAEARRIILEGNGTHFDPVVVQAFQRIEPTLLEIQGADGELNDAVGPVAPRQPSQLVQSITAILKGQDGHCRG
jgi:putative two-component system response regulator